MNFITQIFTWWNRQTFGTFLKTLFFGKFVGKDKFGNKYYVDKKGSRWVIYKKNIEATKIPNDWFLWMHYTVDEIPTENLKKFEWQKDHEENLTGTEKSYKSVNILKKKINKKYDTWKN